MLKSEERATLSNLRQLKELTLEESLHNLQMAEVLVGNLNVHLVLLRMM
jgi:hypothetical protein